jgi:hypothetical protein
MVDIPRERLVVLRKQTPVRAAPTGQRQLSNWTQDFELRRLVFVSDSHTNKIV